MLRPITIPAALLEQGGSSEGETTVKAISVAAIVTAFSLGPASAADDLCTFVNSTISAFVAHEWPDFRGEATKQTQQQSQQYRTTKRPPGFSTCHLHGADVTDTISRNLSCDGFATSLTEANGKVKEIGTQLNKCLPEAKSTNWVDLESGESHAKYLYIHASGPTVIVRAGIISSYDIEIDYDWPK
jgi:hypothetical protein